LDETAWTSLVAETLNDSDAFILCFTVPNYVSFRFCSLFLCFYFMFYKWVYVVM